MVEEARKESREVLDEEEEEDPQEEGAAKWHRTQHGKTVL